MHPLVLRLLHLQRPNPPPPLLVEASKIHTCRYNHASLLTNPYRVRTLSDLGDGDHDEESDDDRHQNFFAGGERSYVVEE